MTEKESNGVVLMDGEKTGRPEDSRAALVEQMTIEEGEGVVIGEVGEWKGGGERRREERRETSQFFAF